jgi:hypothetical protein
LVKDILSQHLRRVAEDSQLKKGFGQRFQVKFTAFLYNSSRKNFNDLLVSDIVVVEDSQQFCQLVGFHVVNHGDEDLGQADEEVVGLELDIFSRYPSGSPHSKFKFSRFDLHYQLVEKKVIFTLVSLPVEVEDQDLDELPLRVFVEDTIDRDEGLNDFVGEIAEDRLNYGLYLREVLLIQNVHTSLPIFDYLKDVDQVFD